MNGARTEPGKTERELFLEVLERTTPGEQAAFLDQACAHDPALRAAVEVLLQHNQDDSFMKSPVIVIPSSEAATQDQPGTPTLAAFGLIFPPRNGCPRGGNISPGALCKPYCHDGTG